MTTSTSALNSDNIKSHLSRVYIDQRQSKEGRPYYMKVEIWNLPNGESYQMEEFVTQEKLAILKLTVPLQTAI